MPRVKIKIKIKVARYGSRLIGSNNFIKCLHQLVKGAVLGHRAVPEVLQMWATHDACQLVGQLPLWRLGVWNLAFCGAPSALQ